MRFSATNNRKGRVETNHLHWGIMLVIGLVIGGIGGWFGREYKFKKDIENIFVGAAEKMKESFDKSGKEISTSLSESRKALEDADQKSAEMLKKSKEEFDKNIHKSDMLIYKPLAQRSLSRILNDSEDPLSRHVECSWEDGESGGKVTMVSMIDESLSSFFEMKKAFFRRILNFCEKSEEIQGIESYHFFGKVVHKDETGDHELYLIKFNISAKKAARLKLSNLDTFEDTYSGKELMVNDVLK